MDAGRGTGAVLNDVRTVAETGSTNADMLALARSGAAEGLWLRAERQTAGRGRLGRTWVSPFGNLYASTLVRLRPTDPAAAMLALVAGVAVEEAVAVFVGEHSGMADLPRHLGPVPGSGRVPGSGLSGAARSPVQPWTPERVRGDGGQVNCLALKWPNDLLLDGAKLAGILLERADDAVVIGFGVNLAHHPEQPDRPATSLAAHGIHVSPETLLDTMADSLARWLDRWRSGGLTPVRARWLERAHPVGTALSVRLPDGTSLDGLFDGLEHDGALVLRFSASLGRALAENERRVIHAGDVFLL